MIHHAGPVAAAEALVWIKDAMSSGRYILDTHYIQKRGRARSVPLVDLKRAIATATKCVKYEGRLPQAGGTNWRVVGTDTDGEETTVGVEAFEDHLGRRIIVVTVF
jgi:hypothetical protein